MSDTITSKLPIINVTYLPGKSLLLYQMYIFMSNDRDLHIYRTTKSLRLISSETTTQ